MVGLIGYALLRLFFTSDFFAISKFQVTGDLRFLSHEDVVRLVQSNSEKKNILLFKTVNLEKNIGETFLGVKEVVVKKSLPSTLKIMVVERTPVALVHNAEEPDNYYLVDSEGYILGFGTPQEDDLPILNYKEELKIGYFINRKLVPAYLELTSLLGNENIKISSMSFDVRNATLYVENGPQVLISNEKDVSMMVLALSELLRQLDLEDKVAEKIDLRYDKVIVLLK